MLTKTKKIVKIANFEKKMVWRYGGEGATYKIWPGSIQRFLRNLSLRTTDGRTVGRTTEDGPMTVALLSQAVKQELNKSL